MFLFNFNNSPSLNWFLFLVNWESSICPTSVNYILSTPTAHFWGAPPLSHHMIWVWSVCVTSCWIWKIFGREPGAALSSQCCLAAVSYRPEPTGVLVRRICDVNADQASNWSHQGRAMARTCFIAKIGLHYDLCDNLHFEHNIWAMCQNTRRHNPGNASIR